TGVSADRRGVGAPPTDFEGTSGASFPRDLPPAGRARSGVSRARALEKSLPVQPVRDRGGGDGDGGAVPPLAGCETHRVLRSTHSFRSGAGAAGAEIPPQPH